MGIWCVDFVVQIFVFQAMCVKSLNCEHICVGERIGKSCVYNLFYVPKCGEWIRGFGN